MLFSSKDFDFALLHQCQQYSWPVELSTEGCWFKYSLDGASILFTVTTKSNTWTTSILLFKYAIDFNMKFDYFQLLISTTSKWISFFIKKTIQR